jgi:tripartite-type tricarboxylate transporter receptor subunit TctC
MTDRPRRRFIRVLLVGALAPSALVHAQAYPSKPIRIVHGYDAGSNPDTVARAIGPALTERLGQPIVIDARPGAGGRIATAHVATQEPDGYSLMMLTAGDGVNAATEPKLPYDLLKDYAFVSMVVQFPFMLLVRADSPYQSLPDFIGTAKQSPGKLTFATPGIRTTQHLSGELIKSLAGIDLLHVPFKGNAFVELLGGRIDSMIAAPSVSTPQVKSGKVRAIAVTGRKRMDAFADVPTVAETIGGFEVTSWLGLAAPARTSGAVIDQLAAEVRHVLMQEAVRSRLIAVGSEPSASTPAEFRARVERDITKWKALASKVRLEG